MESDSEFLTSVVKPSDSAATVSIFSQDILLYEMQSKSFICACVYVNWTNVSQLAVTCMPVILTVGVPETIPKPVLFMTVFLVTALYKQ
jgi:hypothetical protein